MYTFKLLDIVIQGTAILSALVLWIAYDLYGYFYWISFGLIFQILISIMINMIYFRPLSVFRIVISVLYGIIFLSFGLGLLNGSSMAQLNFYFQSISFFIILAYFVLTLTEMNKLKKQEEIDLDF